MKIKITIFILILSFVSFSTSFSEEYALEGEVSVDGGLVQVNGQEGGKAKFTEYRDLQEDGRVFGKIGLGLDSENYFLNFRTSDIGYDDQRYTIDGGLWGKFKLDLFYDEIPHHITFDARTPFLGAGSDTLIGVPNTNIGTWDTFDYSTERHQYGGGLKVDMIKPFFFDASFQREERDGIKPIGAAETSPGGIAFELPEPVHYVTNNLKLDAGYTKKPLFLSFSYLYSDFNNSNISLNLPSSFNPPNALSLPPNNTYYKGAFKGAVNLPFNSKFSTNIGLSKGRSETSIVSLISSAFTGRAETQNYDIALTSNPVRFLDAKVYYKYYSRHNESDDPFEVGDIFLDYKFSTYGAELGFRLPAQVYLNGGYKYVKTKRNKKGETDVEAIFPFNMDNIYYLDLKWTGLDFLAVKVGYEKFDRDANYRTIESAVNPAKRFYYAAQNRDTYKATVDIFPLENLNVGIEYRFKDTDYTDTIFGLRKDRKNEFNFNVDYTLGKIAKVYGYSDFEWVKFNQLQSSTNLPWEANQKDMNSGYGIGTEVYVIPKKLTLIFQHDYIKSNGSVDFTLDPGLFSAGNGLAGIGANNDNIDISRWDDYTRYSFGLKAIYYATKSLLFSLGYYYERFNYNDAQLNNYNFTPTGPPDSNVAFLTGAYKDQSYTANIVFMGATYKF